MLPNMPGISLSEVVIEFLPDPNAPPDRPRTDAGPKKGGSQSSASPLPAPAKTAPSQVALTRSINFPAKVAGKLAGTMEAKVGTIVKVLAVHGEAIDVEYLGSPARVPMDATDYRRRER